MECVDGELLSESYFLNTWVRGLGFPDTYSLTLHCLLMVKHRLSSDVFNARFRVRPDRLSGHL